MTANEFFKKDWIALALFTTCMVLLCILLFPLMTSIALICCGLPLIEEKRQNAQRNGPEEEVDEETANLYYKL